MIEEEFAKRVEIDTMLQELRAINGSYNNPDSTLRRDWSDPKEMEYAYNRLQEIMDYIVRRK